MVRTGEVVNTVTSEHSVTRGSASWQRRVVTLPPKRATPTHLHIRKLPPLWYPIAHAVSSEIGIVVRLPYPGTYFNSRRGKYWLC